MVNQMIFNSRPYLPVLDGYKYMVFVYYKLLHSPTKGMFLQMIFFQFLRVLFNLIIFYFFKKYKQEFSLFHWVYLTGTYSCPVVQ